MKIFALINIIIGILVLILKSNSLLLNWLSGMVLGLTCSVEICLDGVDEIEMPNFAFLVLHSLWRWSPTVRVALLALPLSKTFRIQLCMCLILLGLRCIVRLHPRFPNTNEDVSRIVRQVRVIACLLLAQLSKDHFQEAVDSRAHPRVVLRVGHLILALVGFNVDTIKRSYSMVVEGPDVGHKLLLDRSTEFIDEVLVRGRVLVARQPPVEVGENHVQPLVECHSPRIELSPASLMLLGSLGCTIERLGHISQIHLPFQVFGVG